MSVHLPRRDGPTAGRRGTAIHHRLALTALALTTIGVVAITVREERGDTVHTTVAPAAQDPCRNSSDPQCGPFRWDPQPTNGPLVVEVRTSSQTVRVGEPVTFEVVATDDAPFLPGDCGTTQQYGDESGFPGGCDVGCVGEPTRFGPWDPPSPTSGRVADRFTHTYARPGSYQATFTYASGERCTQDPFASEGRGTVTVTVTAAEPSLPVTG